MRARILLLILFSMCFQALAQTNVLYGYVRNFNLSVNTNVQMQLVLVSPINRTYNGYPISNDPLYSNEDTNGYFSFTNVIWGRYKLLANDGSGTAWTVTVQTNTSGSVSIASLIGSQALPPNPATNYYTMPQVDALIAAIPTGGSGTATNLDGNATNQVSSIVTSVVNAAIPYGYYSYGTTNLASVGFSGIVYNFSPTISPVLQYKVLGVTNGTYVSSSITTNTFSRVQGPSVSEFNMKLTGVGTPSVTLHTEIYVTYDLTNLIALSTNDSQSIKISATTTTNQYSFVNTFPTYFATNGSGVYVVRRTFVEASSGNSLQLYIYNGDGLPSIFSFGGSSVNTSIASTTDLLQGNGLGGATASGLSKANVTTNAGTISAGNLPKSDGHGGILDSGLSAGSVVTNTLLSFTNSLIQFPNTNIVIISGAGTSSANGTLYWDASAGGWTNPTVVLALVNDGGLYWEIGAPPISTLAGRSWYYLDGVSDFNRSLSWTVDTGTAPAPYTAYATNSATSSIRFQINTNNGVFTDGKIYVDPNYGNDYTALRGYKAFPFKTLYSALLYAQPNDVIYVAQGTLSRMLNAQNSSVAYEGKTLFINQQVTIQGEGLSSKLDFGLVLLTNNITLQNLSCGTVFVGGSSITSVLTNINLNNINAIGYSDGLYNWVPSVLTANNCVFGSSFDAFFDGSGAAVGYSDSQKTNSIINLYNCGFISDASLPHTQPIGVTRLVCVSSGSVNIYSGWGKLIQTNASVSSFVSDETGSTLSKYGILNIYGTEFNGTNYGSGGFYSAKIDSALPFVNAYNSTVGRNQIYDPSNRVQIVNAPYSGDGSSLSNLNASALASGTVADARLSTNVALLNANQTWSGSQNITNSGVFGGVAMTNGVLTAVGNVANAAGALVNVQNNNNGANPNLITLLVPNLPNGQTAYFNFGAANGNYNLAALGFYYNGSGSPNNALTITFWGQANKFYFDGSGGFRAVGSIKTDGTIISTNGFVYPSKSSGPTWSQIGASNTIVEWSSNSIPPSKWASYFDAGSNRVDKLIYSFP